MKKKQSSPDFFNYSRVFIFSAIFLAAVLHPIDSHGQSQPFEDGTIYLKIADTSNIEIEYPPNQGASSGNLQALYNLFNQYGVVSANKPFVILQTPVFDRIYKIHFDPSFFALDFINDLQSFSYIEFAEQVPYKTIAQTEPNDPLLPYQLGLMNAFEAFDIHQGGSTIAITDNAILTSHEDLAANIVGEYDVADQDNDASPPSSWNIAGGTLLLSHGTLVSGAAGGVTDNGTGIASAGWNNSILAVKCTNDAAGSNSMTHGFEGVSWAAANGADIINMSWGSSGYCESEYMVIEAARYQFNKILVSSAGNSSQSSGRYPQAYGEGLTGESWEVSDPLLVIYRLPISFYSFDKKD